MKELLLLCGLSLTIVNNNNVTIKNNIKDFDGEKASITNTDSLCFTEAGLQNESEDPISVDGITFDADTVTYTFTNVNYISTGIHSMVKYKTLAETPAPINFVLVGENNLSFTGEDDANTNAFTVWYKTTLNISGTGSLNITSNITAKDKEISGSQYSSSGLFISGTVVVNEGVTLSATGGNGNSASNGIYCIGSLINHGGTIIATSGTSNPEVKVNENGYGMGFYLAAAGDEVPGEYIQDNAKAVLKGICSGESNKSYGIFTDSEEKDYKSSFNVSAGKVYGITKGCYDEETSRSVGVFFTSDTVLTIDNCEINAITELVRSCTVKEDRDSILEPNFVAFELRYSEEDTHFGENAVINAKAPYNPTDGFIATFEDDLEGIYCISENDEEIFGFGLEATYPDDVTMQETFESIVEEKGKFYRNTACFVKIPTDGTVTFVSESGYFKKLKNDTIASIENYKDTKTYGTMYNQKVTSYKEEANAVTYDNTKVFEESSVKFTNIYNEFLAEVKPIVTFVEAQMAAVDYNSKQINASVTEEVALKTEYEAKINAVTLDLNNTSLYAQSLATLKAEFEEKLAELRKPKEEPKKEEPVVEEKKTPIWPFVAGGSLIVVYGVGYGLWKSKKIAFMSKNIFTKMYSWIDKLVAKISKLFKK